MLLVPVKHACWIIIALVGGSFLLGHSLLLGYVSTSSCFSPFLIADGLQSEAADIVCVRKFSSTVLFSVSLSHLDDVI